MQVTIKMPKSGTKAIFRNVNEPEHDDLIAAAAKVGVTTMWDGVSTLTVTGGTTDPIKNDDIMDQFLAKVAIDR
jgi:hypothetical protein